MYGVAKPSTSGFGTAAKAGPEIMLSYRILHNTGAVDCISDFYSENSIQKVHNHRDIVMLSQCAPSFSSKKISKSCDGYTYKVPDH